MGEDCRLQPGVECPQTEKILSMDARIQALERDKEKEQEFRITYYRDRELRASHEAKMDERMEQMRNDLSSIKGWMEEQKNKPNKLVDGLLEKALWAVVAAVITYALVHLGLG